MHPLISIFPLDSINTLSSAFLCYQDIMSFIFFTFAVVPGLMNICLLYLFPNADNQHTKMSTIKRSSSFLLNLMMRPLISFACWFFWGVLSIPTAPCIQDTFRNCPNRPFKSFVMKYLTPWNNLTEFVAGQGFLLADYKKLHQIFKKKSNVSMYRFVDVLLDSFGYNQHFAMVPGIIWSAPFHCTISEFITHEHVILIIVLFHQIGRNWMRDNVFLFYFIICIG